MKKEWTKEELVKAFADFHDAMVYVNANYSTWKSTVVDCDKAFCDLRHL